MNVFNGVCEKRFESWNEFMNFFTTHMLNYEQYIWRGQTKAEWKLESTIDRLSRDASDFEKYKARKRQLECFQFASRGRRGNNPPRIQTENEWWALGQHFGLATPLLDWTHSPFVAAYFAMQDEAPDYLGDRAIYALYKPTVESKAKLLLQEEKANAKSKPVSFMLGVFEPTLQVEFFKPLTDENQRLVNQNGLFTISDIGIGLEDWVVLNFIDCPDMVLIKFLIPSHARPESLKNLNRMNINHLTLFPDLDGAAKYCNMNHTIDCY